MAIVVGIDEAGYGPLLGPLVVSSAAFEIPDELVKTDLWRILRDSVAKKRGRLSGRLLINDSKQVYNRTLGIAHLQRTVLSVMKSLGLQPENIAELLSMLCPDCISRLGGYPWYQRLDLCKLDFDKADAAIAGDVFSRNMAKHTIRPLWLKSCCFDVAYYNRIIENVGNKSNILFTAAASLIQHAFENSASGTIQIIADRQGGRDHYTAGLIKMFPEMQLKVLLETDNDSSYELIAGAKTIKIHFVVGADERFLPVALASMVCKYVRELLNERMNEYFVNFNPALKPTAGYWKDGQRFIKDLQKHAPHAKYEKHQLIRVK
jgi:ribonuclease HII